MGSSDRQTAIVRHGSRFASAAILLVLVAGAASGALDTGPWPMFHRDLRHRAFSTVAPPAGPGIAFSAALSDTVEFSSPVISSSGTVYLGDQGKELWAFTQYATPIWHYHTNGNLRYSSAAVSSNGMVYIGAADGKLYAFREGGYSPLLLWSAQTGGAIKTSPAIATDGSIYVGCDDGKLWSFTENGTFRWSYATGDTIRSSPAIGSDGTIYFGSQDGYVYAIYPDGTLRWRGATGGPIRDCSPAIDGSGNIIIGSTDMMLYSIQPNGYLNWATPTNHAVRSSPALGATGKIYIGAGTQIKCYHGSDGTQSWEFETGARVLSSPAVTNDGVNDVVICGSDNGYVYEVRLGYQVWSTYLGSPVRSSPAIGPLGLAYVGAFNGRLYAVGQLNAAAAGEQPGTPRLILGPNPLPSGSDLAIRWSAAPRDSRGVLRILDVSGRTVRAIDMTAGGESRWDGRDAQGNPVPSGVYLYRFSSGAFESAGRLVRLR